MIVIEEYLGLNRFGINATDVQNTAGNGEERFIAMKARLVFSMRWALTCIICMALGFHLLGIRLELPYVPEVDEPEFVTRAVRMAASGSLNPQWFGHPGSTIIYPLVALYHVLSVITCQGSLFHCDSTLQMNFTSNPSEFYLLGRLLSITFAVLTVPLAYAVGARAFNERTGIAGAGLFALYPIAVSYAQMVRTDSAASFFGMFSLWLCLRVYDGGGIRNHIAAGFFIGLSIATRYFMIALLPILFATHSLMMWRANYPIIGNKMNWVNIGAALLASVAGFMLSTPYFFLDFERAVIDISAQAAVTHLGQDGLTQWGNLFWYLTQAIPQSITWLQTLLVMVGILLVLWGRKPKQILLLGFVATFLAEISLLPLHWQRWVIPVLPLLALFVAYALNASITNLPSRLVWNTFTQHAILIVAFLIISAVPAYQLVLLDIREFNPTTRILAREWILQNIPGGSQIAQEWYTAPLSPSDFAGYGQNRHSKPPEANGFFLFERFSLAQDRELEDYYSEGYRYVVVSSAIYGRYLAEPRRYSVESAFYQKLFSEAHLLKQFDPSLAYGGPVIRVYELESAK